MKLILVVRECFLKSEFLTHSFFLISVHFNGRLDELVIIRNVLSRKFSPCCSWPMCNSI